MNIVVDTSVIIAVLVNEPHKRRLIEATRGADLIAPATLPAEMGYGLSAMFKQRRIELDDALAVARAFQRVAIRISEIDLESAIGLAHKLAVYAYDAYVIGCALKHRCALISLDSGLLDAARRAGVQTIEVTP